MRRADGPRALRHALSLAGLPMRLCVLQGEGKATPRKGAVGRVGSPQLAMLAIFFLSRLFHMSTPGVEPGLSRPRRDVLTTRRCGQLSKRRCLCLQDVDLRASSPVVVFFLFGCSFLQGQRDRVVKVMD